jgi:hypothetical protein
MLMDSSSVTREAHHAAPRCLISLHERANGTSLDGEGIQAWLEWEWEAMRWWGSRGGRETLRRYGPRWFSLLARRRWGRIGPEELEAARVPQ